MAPIDLLAALLVVLAWGCNFVVIKAGVGHFPPFLLAALRFTFAAFPAMFFVRRPPVPWRMMLAYGLLNWVAQIGLLFLAIKVGMPTGLASVVLQSQAFFTLLFAAILLNEHWRAHQLAGLLLAAGGLCLIGVTHPQGLPLAGFLLTLLAAIAWGAGNIVLRRVGRDILGVDMVAFTVWASLIPILPLVLLSLAFEGNASSLVLRLRTVTPLAILSVAYLAWVATLLGNSLWNWLMKRHPAGKVAPFSLLVPVVGLTAARFFLAETLSTLQRIGVVLVLSGLCINMLWGRFRRVIP